MRKLLCLILILCLTLVTAIPCYARNSDETISLSSYLGLSDEKQIVYMYRQGNDPDTKILDHVKFREASEKILLKKDFNHTSPSLSDGLIIKVIDVTTQYEQAVYIGNENEIRSCYFHMAPYTIISFELSYSNKYTLSKPEDMGILNELWSEGEIFDRQASQDIYAGVKILGEDAPFTSFSSKSMYSVGYDVLNMGILPKETGKDFASPITREEFCNVAYNLLARVTDLPTNSKANVFFDINNERVNLLNQIGIIKGKSLNEFAPSAHLTRQEAATILNRMAEFMQIDTSTLSDYKYNDDDKIFEWAKESVYAMFEHSIMIGVGNNNFDPTVIYSKDQAYATIIRLKDLNANLKIK